MILSIANQKGGVGKTTTAQALYSGLILKGFKVLAIDLDPQSNLSTALGADTGDGVNTIFDVMSGKVQDVHSAIQQIGDGFILPSNILLSGAEREFVSKMKREELLISPLNSICDEYDFIIIDTPPSLGILTINAFVASNKIIIPVGADAFSLQGVSQLADTIETVKGFFPVDIGGILLTRYNSRTCLSQELTKVIENAATQLNTKVFNSRIRSSVSIQEAQAQQMNILDYANNSAQLDYKNFVDEFLKDLNDE